MSGPSCPPGAPELFVPLVAWWGLTLAAGVGAAAALVATRVCRSDRAGGGGGGGDGAWPVGAADGSFLRSGGGGGFGGGLGGEGDAGGGRPSASWEVAWRDLRFGARVGMGNVGEVFRGAFRGREVAIKRLLPGWARDADMVARFREEIALLSSMNHPNVLGFVGAVVDADAGRVCLVTELCARGTLSELLAGPDPLPWRARLSLAWQVARGMAYLHDVAHVTQRDLKTANLLVTEHYEVKIADFGLSRPLAPVMETYCGTPANMAPEVTRQAPYDHRADVFSFGVIMWELLTRQEAYPGVTGIALALAVATRGLRPPVPAYCPAEWAALMCRAWDASPDARPSFETIQRDLLRMITALDEAEGGAAAAAARARGQGGAAAAGATDGGGDAPRQRRAAAPPGALARGNIVPPPAAAGPRGGGGAPGAAAPAAAVKELPAAAAAAGGATPR